MRAVIAPLRVNCRENLRDADRPCQDVKRQSLAPARLLHFRLHTDASQSPDLYTRGLIHRDTDISQHCLLRIPYDTRSHVRGCSKRKYNGNHQPKRQTGTNERPRHDFLDDT